MEAGNALQQLMYAPFRCVDPGNGGTWTVDRDLGLLPIAVTSGNETRSISAPNKSGLVVTVQLMSNAGTNCTLTASDGSTFDGANTSIVFTNVTDMVILESIHASASTYRWQAIFVKGATGLTNSIASQTVTTETVVNSTVSQQQVTQTVVNAAGSAIGNAAALSYGMNVVNAANNSAGVQLPAAIANTVVDVLQITNGKALNIYPQVNSSIAGLGANAAFNTGTANTGATNGTTDNVWFRFIATNATQWYASK